MQENTKPLQQPLQIVRPLSTCCLYQGTRLSLPVAMPTREVSWVGISLPVPSLSVPSIQGHDLLCSGVGLSEKMEMQFSRAWLGVRSAELPL